MAIQFLIGNQDYTNLIDLSSLKISSNIAVTKDTANFDVIIGRQAKPRPKGGQEIKILNGATTEFGGVLVNPKELALAPDTMQYQTQCRDYVYWLDKRVVTNTYTGYTIGNMVKDIVANFTSGFTSNNVQGTGASFLLSEKKFDHVPPSQAIKALADAVAFQWYVDYLKDVHFGPITTIPSPLPNNLLDVDNDTTSYGDLEFDEDVSQVRNQIYLKGYKLPAAYAITQNFVCDGQSDTFYTAYEPKHKLSTITVTLGGVPQAKDLDLVGGLPSNQMADGKVYVNYKNNSYRFNAAPALNTVLSITYVPMFEMISMYNDPNAMSVMAQRDFQDGVYEYAVRDQQLTSIDAGLANIRGQLELYKYAYPRYSGKFKSFLQGWQPGQYFYLTSNLRMDGQFQNQQFFVIKVEKTIVSHPLNGSPTFFYTVYFSDTPYSI